jgi:hypothetical protein
MRPLFTVHAGELLVGQHIEQSFKGKNVWVPPRTRALISLGYESQKYENGNTSSEVLQGFSAHYEIRNTGD